MSIEKILSHYQVNNQKVINNLKRIFNQGALKGTGKLLILAVDHGFEHGPDKSFSNNPAAYDPEYHFNLAIKGGCNALTAPLGFLEIGAKRYADKIPLILKLNSSDSLYKNENNNAFSAITATAQDAVRMGCIGVGFTIYPGSKFSRTIYEQAQKIIKEAREYGLITVIWAYPRGEQISLNKQSRVDILAYAVQIACQLGADLIKTKFPFSNEGELVENKNPANRENLAISLSRNCKNPANRENLVTRSACNKIVKIKQIMKGAFNNKRIVLFSGGESKDKEKLYQETKIIKQGGGFGSILGRNIFQRPKREALEMISEVVKIYKKEA